jgi:hypothetical protein
MPHGVAWDGTSAYVFRGRRLTAEENSRCLRRCANLLVKENVWSWRPCDSTRKTVYKGTELLDTTKRRQVLNSWYSVTSQKTWILNCKACSAGGHFRQQSVSDGQCDATPRTLLWRWRHNFLPKQLYFYHQRRRQCCVSCLCVLISWQVRKYIHIFRAFHHIAELRREK